MKALGISIAIQVHYGRGCRVVIDVKAENEEQYLLPNTRYRPIVYTTYTTSTYIVAAISIDN